MSSDLMIPLDMCVTSCLDHILDMGRMFVMITNQTLSNASTAAQSEAVLRLEPALSWTAVPPGDCGEVQLPIPCMFGKLSYSHQTSTTWTCAMVPQSCRHFSNQRILRSASQLEISRLAIMAERRCCSAGLF